MFPVWPYKQPVAAALACALTLAILESTIHLPSTLRVVLVGLSAGVVSALTLERKRIAAVSDPRSEELSRTPSTLPRRRLVGVIATIEIANWIGFASLILLIFDHTESALAVAATYFVARPFPQLLRPTFLYLTRLPYGFLLAFICAIQICVYGFFVALTDDFSFPAVIAVAIVEGIVTMTARTAIQEVLSIRTDAHSDLLFNRGFVRAYGFAGLFGPLAAGTIVWTSGSALGFRTAGLLFFVTALVGATINLKSVPISPVGFRLTARIELAALSTKRSILPLLTTLSAPYIFLGAGSMQVVFAKQTLGAGNAGFAALIGSSALGLALSQPMLALRFRANPRWQEMVISFGFLLWALAPNIAVACAAAALTVGSSGAYALTAIRSIDEANVPGGDALPAVLSKLMHGALAISLVLSGALSTIFGTRASFLFAAGGLLLLSVIGRHLDSSLDIRDTKSRANHGTSTPIEAVTPLY